MLLGIFIAISSLFLLLGAYIIVTRGSLYPQFIITICGEMLRSVREHVHFNPDGVLSLLILFTVALGISLAVVQVVRYAISHRRLNRRYVCMDRFPENLEWVIDRHNLQRAIIAVIGGSKITAYTIGLLRPQIVISKPLINKASRRQLEAVMLHEIYHVQNRHVLWLLLMRLVSSFLFFIPIVGYLARQLKARFEFTADSFVIKKQNTRDYLCGSLALNLQYAGGIIPHFSTSPIERRVEFLVSEKFSLEKIRTWQFSISLFSIILMICLAVIKPNKASFVYDHKTDATCLTKKECQAINCNNHRSMGKNYFTYLPSSFFQPLSSS